MKKIFYLFAITAFMFTSCNPLEDINTEVDALTKNDKLVDDLVLTLTDEDYETLELSFGNFSNNEDAKTLIPGFLSETYPQLGVTYLPNGEIDQSSSALVTYKLYSPIKFEAYTVTDADYTALGLSSLNDSDDFEAFFDLKYPSEVEGTVVDLTYKTEPTITDYSLTDDDYDLVGNGRYDNFDADETDEEVRVKIQTILLNNFPDADLGTKFNISYQQYNGSTTDDLEMQVILEDNPTDPATTTTYKLQEEDYELIGNGTFYNFDIRETSAEADVEVRREKIETILLNNYPSAEVGDFFVISYDTYDGVNRPVLTMILQFDGTNYNIFDVKVYAAYEFALVENTMRFTLTDEWSAPITFSSEEYELLGGSARFNNFSGDEDEAKRTIAIYLKNTLYPYAAAEDFVAVQYAFYNGSDTLTRNANFVFDGTVWNAIPTVINTSLKFGHNGITWVPDNTIKYTLINSDYALVGNGQYNNFDLRAGKAEETIEVRLEKINTILKANFPNSEQGQKFAVTYAFYDGTNGSATINVILEGSDYILQ